MTRYSMEPWTRKYVQVYDFVIPEKSIQQIWEKLLDTATETIYSAKSESTEVVHKTAEAKSRAYSRK